MALNIYTSHINKENITKQNFVYNKINKFVCLKVLNKKCIEIFEFFTFTKKENRIFLNSKIFCLQILFAALYVTKQYFAFYKHSSFTHYRCYVGMIKYIKKKK